MRTLLLLMCSIAASSAQVTTVPVAVPLSTELAAYLQLNFDQVQRTKQLYADYNSFAAAKNQRIAQVQGEIGGETARSPLDPMGLGVRYAEIETIRREIRTQLETVHKQIRELLTDAQNAKIDILSRAAGLQPLVYEAGAVNLIAPLASTFSGTVLIRSGDFTSGSVSFGYIPVSSRLIVYLQLTADQAGKINQLNSDLVKSIQPRDQRVAEVQSEIVQETAKSPLDSMALGLRYAEIETIRRQEQSDLDALRVNIRSLLVDSQKTKVATLEDAAKLQPLVSQAACLGILPSGPAIVIPVIRPVPSAGLPELLSPSCGGGSFIFDPLASVRAFRPE